MFLFLKKWKRRREIKKLEKLVKEWQEIQENLINKVETIEGFANKRIKELELKLNQIETQFEIFEKIIDSLDPQKRIN
uniref:Uncharacterized protein n=1 Tax=Thermodesulfovibrio aggregans TaxID=86166 RepID=A0A7C4EJR2_9BACT